MASLDQYTFNGVAQVVARLFDIVKPDYAVFGEKDYQQLLIINSLVERQGIKTTIVSVPTVRESRWLGDEYQKQLLEF